MTATTGPRPGQITVQDAPIQRRQPDEEWRREQINLAHRYGQIGISAVAAALRYTDVAKNKAYAPAVIKIDARFIDAAA